MDDFIRGVELEASTDLRERSDNLDRDITRVTATGPQSRVFDPRIMRNEIWWDAVKAKHVACQDAVAYVLVVISTTTKSLKETADGKPCLRS